MSTLRVNALQSSAGTGTPTTLNAPALSAVRITGSQSVTSGAWTKAQYNSVTYDPTGAWDAANFRFTPQTAGMYSVQAVLDSSGSVSTTNVTLAVYKNGTQVRAGSSNGTTNSRANVAAAITMNGSTDYLEVWINISGSSPAAAGNVDMFLVRAGV
ncbi:hypothetical protein [Hydrogenophaga sp.]|uniref:hypothetical protein n=1 Tax=Hydrogenophaga sp. TaxID=1904254 RepID=UPI002FC71D9D